MDATYDIGEGPKSVFFKRGPVAHPPPDNWPQRRRGSVGSIMRVPASLGVLPIQA